MKLIETPEDFNVMKDLVKNVDILVIPIFCDTKTHPAMNPICVFGVSTGPESFLIGFNHTDVQSLDINTLSCLAECQRVWTPDKKTLDGIYKGTNVFDVNSIIYLAGQEICDSTKFLTDTHKFMYTKYERQVRINKSVPIMKHIEYISNMMTYYWEKISTLGHIIEEQSFKFLNNMAIPVLSSLEYNGIAIVPDLLRDKYGPKIDRFINKNLVYSQYNLYTSTGRCSNRFAGVNFAALNKSDDTRDAYISRFDNGVLIMMDFESFHLRLIADMIGYEFPVDEPVHEFLAKQYFNTDDLTQDQYNEGKAITFKLLYGEGRNNNVPEFFKKTYEYIDMLSVLLDVQGYILSPYFKRRISKENLQNASSSKIFNYMIQLAETERNLSVMTKLMPVFENKESKPVLYTYDSILFDFNPTDGRDLLKFVSEILTENGKYPIRSYFGKSYKSMQQVYV